MIATAPPAVRDDLLALLACPGCLRGDLTGLRDDVADGQIACTGCGASYPVRGGIPILLPPGTDESHLHDEIDHVHGHKQQQAAYFDRAVVEEFETTRPHGAPVAYRWLLEEKFRRSIAHLPALSGATVVDACCGSGMDAEMLARQGARVLAVDISEGCAQRARRRAEGYGLDYLVVVGDVERLPVKTAGADIAYVHDGLHHLPEPERGLRELARIATKAVSVNEPADALGTALMVRLGVSLAVEGAGNRVARLRSDEVAAILVSAGFDDVRCHRYLMYYQHEPGRLLRLASRPMLRHGYRAVVRLADRALGRWGNKLQVTALKTWP